MTRALGVIRLSELTDRTTSPERQREVIEAAACARGSELVGWAVDLDVSASKVHPMKRPELSAWLARPDDFDEILFWRLDRIVRSSFDWADLMRWADAQGKILASATEGIDLATKIGRMLAGIIVSVAEMESENTKERVLGAHEYLRQAGRFGGGRPPYGFRAVKVPPGQGQGWKVVRDPETSAVVLEAAERVISGEAVNSVVADFNRRKIQPPGPQHKRSAKDDKEPTWRGDTLRRILRSPALLGYGVHEEKAVTGPDGMPVMRGEPLLRQSRYDELQHALDQLARPGTGPFTRSQTPTLLLGVAWCGHCLSDHDGLAKMHRGTRGTWNRGPRIPHYICSRASQSAQFGDRCRARTVLASWLDECATVAFLAQCGDTDEMERVWIAGEDHADELATVRAALEGCRAEYDRGGYAYPGGQDDYDSRTARLSDRVAALSALPSRPARYELKPTGRTLRQAWEAATVGERRKLMLDAGWRVLADRLHDGRLHLRLAIDPGIARRAGLAASGQPVTAPWPPEPFDPAKVREGINIYLSPDDDIAARMARILADRDYVPGAEADDE